MALLRLSVSLPGPHTTSLALTYEVRGNLALSFGIRRVAPAFLLGIAHLAGLLCPAPAKLSELSNLCPLDRVLDLPLGRFVVLVREGPPGHLRADSGPALNAFERHAVLDELVPQDSPKVTASSCDIVVKYKAQQAASQELLARRPIR